MSATVGNAFTRTSSSAPRRRRVALPPLIALGFGAVVGLLLLTPGRPDDPATVLQSRTLHVTTAADGTVDLTDTRTGALAGHIPGEGDSFIRGVLHSTERMRKMHDIDQNAPYRLVAMSNGRLVLEDLGSGLQVDLEAFGQGNAGAFADLLEKAP